VFAAQSAHIVLRFRHGCANLSRTCLLAAGEWPQARPL